MIKPIVDKEGYYPFGFPLQSIQEDWPVGLFRMDISKYRNNMTDHNIEVKTAPAHADKAAEVKPAHTHEHIDATKHAPAHKPA